MDIKEFYEKVDAFFKQSESSLFDKLKLDSSDLVNAVKSNNPDEVAKALNAWVNPNKEDGLGRLPLPFAVENNSNLIVGMLLRKKADPNVLGEDGQSPLFKAVFWENEDLVQILLKAGAEIEFSNKDGKTALDQAISSGYTNIISILRGEKSVARSKQIAKDKATHQQMRDKAEIIKKEKVESLIAKKAKEDKILQNAIERKYLQNGSSIELALGAAIKSKDSDAVKYFVEKVKDLNSLDIENNPLALAINLDQSKLADYLIESGADLFFKQAEENEYLIFLNAIRKQQYGLVEKALQKKTNPLDILNDAKQSLSAQFLAYKDPKMFDILIQAGADPYFGGSEGISPIKKAIEKGSIAILPVLSKNKVDLSIQTEGKTLLDWAVNYKRFDWLNGLIAEGAISKMNQNDLENLLKEANQVEGQEESIINLINSCLNKV